MNDTTRTRGRSARWAGAAGLLAAGAITGGVLAGTLSASAATTTASTPGSSSSSSTTQSGTGQAPPTFPAHGSAAHESAEKPVTGTNATKAQAAAVTVVGGGTAGAVTTDMTGTGFETTVTKADGSTVEVHLDSSFNAVGHGGGPDGGHGPGPVPGAGNGLGG